MKYHNIEIESAIITCILSKPSLINQVIDEINPYDFEDTNNKIILWVLYKINNDGNEIELNTVIDYLKKGKKYNQVKDHLTGIMAGMPASTGLTYYLKQIEEGKVKAQLVILIEKINSNLKSDQVPTDISIQDIFSFLSNIDNHKNEGITEMIKKYIDNTSGTFYLNDIYSVLVIKTQKEKHAAVVALSRLSKEGGPLKKSKSRAGQYRIINKEVTLKDWKNAKTEKIDFTLPMGMHEAVRIRPGSIILFSGSNNAGKTAMAMEIIALNCSKFKTYYFSSETEEAEFKERAFAYGPLDNWDCSFADGWDPSNIEDIIDADGLNVIDYLEPPGGDYTLMAVKLTEIHKALDRGVAVVCLQKKGESDFGVGGEYMLNKPQFACNLDKTNYPVCKLTIRKCKAPQQGYVNPGGLSVEYKIARNGVHIRPYGKFDFQQYDRDIT